MVISKGFKKLTTVLVSSYSYGYALATSIINLNIKTDCHGYDDTVFNLYTRKNIN
jgi:hypothetical protein